MIINLLRDSLGNIVQASSEPLTASTGLTLVEGLEDWPADFRASALLDDAGRCVWRYAGGAIVAGAARWPATPALKRQAAARLRARIDQALLDIIALERWQSDPDNVAVADRANELTATRARFVALRDILAGA